MTNGEYTPRGARASGSGLTPTEERVARLVAVGRRNDEVAAELGIGTKTVETHLTRIYRKLRVRSRTELAALGESGVSPRPNGSFTKSDLQPILKSTAGGAGSDA